MDNQDELQELDLEAIMREFHDPSKDLPPEEPKTVPKEDEEAAHLLIPYEFLEGESVSKIN